MYVAVGCGGRADRQATIEQRRPEEARHNHSAEQDRLFHCEHHKHIPALCVYVCMLCMWGYRRSFLKEARHNHSAEHDRFLHCKHHKHTTAFCVHIFTLCAHAAPRKCHENSSQAPLCTRMRVCMYVCVYVLTLCAHTAPSKCHERSSQASRRRPRITGALVGWI